MISIGFSTTNKLLSRIIRFFSRAKASHAWLLYMDVSLNNREMVMQAELNGVVIVPYDYFKTRNKIVAVIDPQIDMQPGLDAMTNALGMWYDVGGLIGSAWVLIGRWMKRKWSNPFDNPHALFCSEAIVLALQAARYPNAASLIPSSATPQDLLDFLQEGGAKIVGGDI